MIRKLSAFILCVTSSCAVIYSQKTTEPQSKQPNEKRAQTRLFADSFGSSGYLGVQTQEITRENFSKYGLNEVRGVGVEKVLENSPAAQAGVQNGDVIVRFNGEEITSTRKLLRLIGEVAPDHQVRLAIVRGGSEREITVTMGKRPFPRFEEGVFEMKIPAGEMPMKIQIPIIPPAGQAPQVKNFPPVGDVNKDFMIFRGGARQIGASMMPLNKQLAEYFGVGGGLLINDVRADSPAAKAGLKAGDVIVEVEGKEVKKLGDFIRAIAEKKEGDVNLTIVRDRNRQTVRVTPEAMKGNEFFFEFDDNDGLFTTPIPPVPVMPEVPNVKPAVSPASLPPVPVAPPARVM